MVYVGFTASCMRTKTVMQTSWAHELFAVIPLSACVCSVHAFIFLCLLLLFTSYQHAWCMCTCMHTRVCMHISRLTLIHGSYLLSLPCSVTNIACFLVHTRMYTCIHTHTHNTDTCMHAYIRICQHVSMHTFSCTWKHIRPHMHTGMYAWTHACCHTLNQQHIRIVSLYNNHKNKKQKIFFHVF